MCAQRYFGFLNATRAYFKSLASQAVGLPSYGVQLQWDNFIRTLSPRPTNASMVQPRNLAAYYANDPTALFLDGSNNVILWEDWSGNSATNALCLNGVAGNYASTPDSPNIPVGDMTIQVDVAANTYIPAGTISFVAHDPGATNRSFVFGLAGGASSLTMRFVISVNGTAQSAVNSNAIVGISDFQRVILRVMRRASDGLCTFSYSTDGRGSFTSAGSFVTTGGNLFDSTGALEIGAASVGTTNSASARIYRATIWSDLTQTSLAYDVNFGAVAKLATSFTESSANAATVTVNSTGDTGARVAGERDLYQGTSTKRPAYTTAVGRSRLFMTFDGVDDYLKAPGFALAQPVSHYMVASQLTWTTGDRFFDGDSSGSTYIVQTTGSPLLSLFAGSTLGSIAPPLQTLSIILAIFNGATSVLTFNRQISAVGAGGAGTPNGYTLGAGGAGTVNGNIAVREVAIYSEASNAATAAQITNYLANKYSVSL